MQFISESANVVWVGTRIPPVCQDTSTLCLIPPSFFAPGKASHGRRHSHLGGRLCLLWTRAFTSPPFSSELTSNPLFTGKGLLFTLAQYLGEPYKALVSARTPGFCTGSPEEEGSSAGWLFGTQLVADSSHCMKVLLQGLGNNSLREDLAMHAWRPEFWSPAPT